MSVQVKICGLTNQADARVAIAAGADLLGFILYPKSPRYVSPDDIRRILTNLQPQLSIVGRPIYTVGVCVNLPVPRVQQILKQTGLDLAQLHGDESVAEVSALATCAFKALRPNTAEAQADARTYAQVVAHSAPSLLVDAYDAAAYGGTGRRADWTLAAKIAREIPGLLLAGGLTPTNVAQAVRTVRPWGVDVSSGVEETPGHKNHTAVRNFVTHAKATSIHADPTV